MPESFEDRIKQDHEYWRQAKFIRGEQGDVYTIDGLAILTIVGLAFLAIPVLWVFNALGIEEPGLLGGIVTIGLFVCLFGKVILRVLSQIKN